MGNISPWRKKKGYHFMFLQYYIYNLKQWENVEPDSELVRKKETSSKVNDGVPHQVLLLMLCFLIGCTVPFIRQPYHIGKKSIDVLEYLP